MAILSRIIGLQSSGVASLQLGKPIKRWNSISVSITERPKQKRLAPMNLIILPITTKKNFVYYNYHQSFDQSTYLELQYKNAANLPYMEKLKIKLQIQLLKLSAKLSNSWQKMGTSDNKVLRHSYNIVQGLLEKISWFETCLSSIPSRETILREINTEIQSTAKDGTQFEYAQLQALKDKHRKRVDFYKSLQTQEILNSTIPTARESDLKNVPEVYSQLLKPIPLYYPKSVISSLEVSKFLESIQDRYYKLHVKAMIYCLIGLPLTVPFILLPVVPNIPGFYLCYRIYCHVKVLSGLKHLGYLTNDKLPSFADKQTVEGHLEYFNVEELNSIYLKHAKAEVSHKASNDSTEIPERLVINEDIIKDVIEITGLKSIEGPLQNSLLQERKKLNIVQ